MQSLEFFGHGFNTITSTVTPEFTRSGVFLLCGPHPLA